MSDYLTDNPPRIFLDQQNAEMMVYALENHFKRITALLDNTTVPKTYPNPDSLAEKKHLPLTVEQRVCILIQMYDGLDPEPEVKHSAWEVNNFLERAVYSEDDTMDYDAEDLAVKLHDLHEELEKAKALGNINRLKGISDPAGGPDYYPDLPVAASMDEQLKAGLDGLR